MTGNNIRGSHGRVRCALACCALLGVLSLSAYSVLELPDLSVGYIAALPESFLPTDVVIVAVTITNRGTAPTSSPFHCQLFIDGLEVARKAIRETIPPKGVVDVAFPWRFAAGAHTVSVVVDGPEDAIPEEDETNNSQTLATLSGYAPAASLAWLQELEGGVAVFCEGFEMDGSELGAEYGWTRMAVDGGYVLAGLPGTVRDWLDFGDRTWSDITLSTDVCVEGTGTRIGYRSCGTGRYYVELQPGMPILLGKETWGQQQPLEVLETSSIYCKAGEWINVTILGEAGRIRVFVNQALVIDYQDATPFLAGRVNFEPRDGEILIDNVVVAKQPSLSELCVWESCGGPFGGIGYDVPFHPVDHDIMFVTDASAGIFKSFDQGAHWISKNAGIMAADSTQGGTGNFPVFCVTIDPNDPDIVWIGTIQGSGIYRSADGGETWERRFNGIEEAPDDLDIRGFTVVPGDSDTVYMQAGVQTDVLSPWTMNPFMRRGVIYRTTDAGGQWTKIWEGDNLARFVIIDPTDHQTLYASTGIFDYTAENGIGVGILKSSDGGDTWRTINNGVYCLSIGYLAMHPQDSSVLLAAGGNLEQGGIGIVGGVYRTSDGGENWELILADDGGYFEVVAFAPSNPNVVYAGHAEAFYRSDDGGLNWTRFNRSNGLQIGPPGSPGGHPIGISVHPTNPMLVYLNSYGGGVFRSADGGRTWEDYSYGLTSSDVRSVAVTAGSTSNVLVASKVSGLFRYDADEKTWAGITYGPIATSGFHLIRANPSRPNEVLAAGRHYEFYRSTDGGNSWVTVNSAMPRRYTAEHMVSALAFSPSDPDRVYIGYDGLDDRSYGVYRSDSGGRLWSKKNGGMLETSMRVASLAVHPTDPDTVYVGTVQDGVFKTTDGGNNWVPASGGLGAAHVSALAIDPLFPETVYAGLGEGVGLAISTDGGASWESLNEGLSVVCPSFLARVGQVRPGLTLEPRTAPYAAYSSAGWSVITAIEIDPTDNLRIYVSDADQGVFVSSNGLPWERISHGLALLSIEDLALSEDGRVLYAATHGAGVYRLAVPQ